MTPETKEFLLAEYSALRDEVLDALKQVPANERWAVVVSGAFWAWFASDPQHFTFALPIAWLPTVLAILFCLRWRALEAKFDTFNSYLRKVEKSFDLGELGWEQFLNHTETTTDGSGLGTRSGGFGGSYWLAT